MVTAFWYLLIVCQNSTSSIPVKVGEICELKRKEIILSVDTQCHVSCVLGAMPK